MTTPKRASVLAIIGPGILLAATGVGAGDLSVASFCGTTLGLAVLWAVVVGAGLKYALNEGLTRWQLATGDTLLEGCMQHIGWPFKLLFPLYLLPWSFFVGSALISACGVAAHALIPVFEKATTGKVVFGIIHSLLGLGLVRFGGYRLFQRVMSVCVAVMCGTVVLTAVLIRPDWSAVLRGLFIPTIPKLDTGGLGWTVGLMGGVGGTLTLICYGYWIREEGRQSIEELRTCRIDLAVGYVVTALFGFAMVIIGSRIVVEGKGAGLVVALAACLEEPLGSVGKWAFLVGAWGAVFSSLLGVWHSVPYVFADFCGMLRNPSGTEKAKVSTDSRLYRYFLYGLTIVPMISLAYSFREVERYYAIIGACFMPFLAAVLLFLNGRPKWVGGRYRNGLTSTLILGGTLLFFLFASYLKLRSKFG